MLHGDEITVLDDGLYVAAKSLEAIGIHDDSVCWGVWLFDPREKTAPKRQVPHLFISPVPPRAWPISVRMQIALNDHPGALARASRVLGDLNVDILYSRATPTGHHHAIWTVIVENTVKRDEYRLERERLFSERRHAGWENAIDWEYLAFRAAAEASNEDRSNEENTDKEIIKTYIEELKKLESESSFRRPRLEVQRVHRAIDLAERLRRRVGEDAAFFIRRLKLALLSEHVRLVAESKGRDTRDAGFLHDKLFHEKRLFWNMPVGMMPEAVPGQDWKLGDGYPPVGIARRMPHSQWNTVDEAQKEQLRLWKEEEQSRADQERVLKKAIYELADTMPEDMRKEIPRGVRRFVESLEHPWDAPGRYKNPVMTGCGMPYLAHAWLFGAHVNSPMKFKYLKKDALLKIVNRRSRYKEILSKLGSGLPQKMVASFHPEDYCLRVCFRKPEARRTRVLARIHYETTAPPEADRYRHSSYGLFAKLLDGLNAAKVDLVRVSNSLNDRTHDTDRGIIEAGGFVDTQDFELTEDALRAIRNELLKVTVERKDGGCGKSIITGDTTVHEDRLDELFVSTRLGLLEEKPSLADGTKAAAKELGFQAVILDQAVVGITHKVQAAIQQARAFLQVIPILAGRDGKLEELKHVHLDWLLFEYALALSAGLPIAICVDLTNGLTIGDWLQRLPTAPNRTFFTFNSRNGQTQIITSLKDAIKWLRAQVADL